MLKYIDETFVALVNVESYLGLVEICGIMYINDKSYDSFNLTHTLIFI